ncbi:hypothetical protein KDA_44310 [Dictyobacter alpinus]|uniref:histidine kinase n=1 Tax=Dictyobacter alpinus TaxID=2014873 RepID=A0A402BCD6_9CHLR|nr:PAS domain-containing sensor histidine kinase [Dictyobacter alpinus]GCE28947.1 hypothetical protein KDA_44310 [Dictyobacter alpinus]
MSLPDPHAASTHIEGDQSASSDSFLLFQSTILENVRDSVIVTDLQHRITYWNHASTQLFGYTPEEILGHTPDHLYPQVDEAQRIHDFQELYEQQEDVDEWQGRRKDGSLVWIDVKSTILRDADDNILGFLSISRDITERKEAEERLRRSQERYRLVAENVSDIISLVDLNGNWRYVSPSLKTLLGYEPGELIGTSTFTLVHPDELAVIQKGFADALAGQKVHTIARYKHKDGRWIILETSGIAIFDERGQVDRIVCTSTDITERTELEKRKDEFISMASHELKTPVTSIKAYTQVLRNRFQKRGDDETVHFLQRMDAQLTKLSTLINDLLDITKMQAGKITYREEQFQLDELVKEIVENVQEMTPTHRLQLTSEENISIYGDRDRLGQVVINLLTNAIKYSPGADKVCISVVRQDKQAIVSVQDFGIGIDKIHQEKIFERFYQVTDPLEKTFPGLGIGLYISSEIIKRYHGSMSFESEKGVGSTFSFHLPLQ